MPRKIVKNSSQKVTISLPITVLNLIDSFVREQEADRNTIIVEMLSRAARERFEAEMRDACLEHAEEAQQIAEEWFPFAAEIWPEWESEDKE